MQRFSSICNTINDSGTQWKRPESLNTCSFLFYSFIRLQSFLIHFQNWRTFVMLLAKMTLTNIISERNVRSIWKWFSMLYECERSNNSWKLVDKSECIEIDGRQFVRLHFTINRLTNTSSTANCNLYFHPPRFFRICFTCEFSVMWISTFSFVDFFQWVWQEKLEAIVVASVIFP